MRLQLNIQRHALPATNILWTVRAQDPVSTAAHASATISQLLEDVNDIVQLESEDWGLEDYAVEVGGYECLHFQPIDSVLKEDDKVTIRALQTSDLRVRRIGGRHQIAPDGRHLFDGVAFGRPYLRKTARPAFRIPPRKRRKLNPGYEEDNEGDSTVHALLGDSGNAAEIASGNKDVEGDPHPDNDNQFQIVAKEYFEDADHVSSGEENNDSDSNSDSDFDSFFDEDGDDEDLDLSNELKALLEDDPSEPYDDEHEENEVSFEPLDGDLAMNSSEDAVQRKKRKWESDGVSEDENNVHSMGGPNSPTVTARIAQDNEATSSPVSAPGPGSQISDGMSFAAAQSLPSSDPFEGFDDTSRLSDPRSLGATSSEPESELGSSDTSSAVSASDSCTTSESSSDSESMSESDSDSESESESNSESSSDSISHAENEDEFADATLSPMRTKTGQSAEDSISLSARPASVQSAPGEGSNRTRKTNRRNKRKRKLDFLKASGLLAPDAGFKELSIFEQTEFEAHELHDLTPAGALDDVFEARKKEILEQTAQPQPEPDLTPVDEPTRKSSERESQRSSTQQSSIPAQPSGSTDKGDHPAPLKQRAKLDIASSRRMLFGSLGLKTPKTPAAEQELREKLAQQGRPSANGRAKQTVTHAEDDAKTIVKAASLPNQPEAWKHKLVLTAVECEVEGEELPTPPFPFAQPWQYAEQRNELQVHPNNHDEIDVETIRDTSAAGDELSSSGVHVDGDPVLDGVRLNGAIQNQLIQEAKELSERQEKNGPLAPDLPLITDLDGLEALKAEDAVAGTVVAFKQLEMSRKTDWQPEMSAYRTAKVEEVLEDRTLRILLAKRDRTAVPPAYDEETGRRIFDKFEMPMDDEEEGDAVNGIREVSFGDLIEPKLVERCFSHSSVPQPTQAAQERISGPGPDEEIAVVQDSATSTNHSGEHTSAQVEVSTPRQREISKLIKDAGFHSSIGSELLEPTPESGKEAINGADNSEASPTTSEKHSGSRSMNLDGAASEPDISRLDSPLFAGGDSSSVPHEDHFYDSSSFGQGRRSPGIKESPEDKDQGTKRSVEYPRLSALVRDESRTLTMNGKLQSTRANLVESSKHVHDSDAFSKDNNSIMETGNSYFDSLKSTIPPSEDAAPKAGPPSATGSLYTNPCYSEVDGNASSEDDLPSFSEITSTARSGRISPPQIKKSVSEKRKTSTSPDIPSSPSEQAFTESNTQTQTSSRFEPSQIPPGSQFMDLTLSSDPIVPEDDDEDHGSTQRSSVRIKQGSSQTKTGLSLSSNTKIGNRHLVRGKFGRPKARRPGVY